MSWPADDDNGSIREHSRAGEGGGVRIDAIGESNNASCNGEVVVATITDTVVEWRITLVLTIEKTVLMKQ